METTIGKVKGVSEKPNGKWSVMVNDMWLWGAGPHPMKGADYVFSYEDNKTETTTFHNIKHFRLAEASEVPVEPPKDELRSADTITKTETFEGQKRIDIIRAVALKAAVDSISIVESTALVKDKTAESVIELAKKYEDYLKGE